MCLLITFAAYGQNKRVLKIKPSGSELVTYTFTITKGDHPAATSIIDTFAFRPYVKVTNNPCCTFYVKVPKKDRITNPGFTFGTGDGNGCYFDLTIWQYNNTRIAKLNETTQCNGTFEKFRIKMARDSNDDTKYTITLNKAR